MKNAKLRALRAIILFPALVAGCASASDFKRPDASELAPADWRWKVAEPTAEMPKGAWWRLYGDTELNRLEELALSGNQTIAAAAAKVEQARALARMSKSQLYPNLSGNGAYQHQRLSGNRPLPISTPMEVTPMDTDSHSLSLDMVYELDLFGRIRHGEASTRNQAVANAADLETIRLTIAADLAANYFALRAKDVDVASLQRAVELRQDTANILGERFHKGLIPEIDASQALTELASAKADLSGALRERATLANAIALLCGRAPASLDIAPAAGPMSENPPLVPAGIPSRLLERRSDIAAAERRLEARYEEIGAARAACFPSISLVGSGGYLSTEASSLFSGDSATWSVAPKVSLPLFTAGRTKAEVERAKAAYDEALANYRQSVLAAMREVEDALASSAYLAEEQAAQMQALEFARHTADLAAARYQSGLVDYITVATAERNVLAQERKSALLTAQRYAASVRLVKALGGSWETGGN
ncbi:MAG TPA: efflux transporter outer membrane subunit [Opitutales bacterium]|nr:efflux transporter outer membrane subunit [Opitutales bacterium]